MADSRSSLPPRDLVGLTDANHPPADSFEIEARVLEKELVPVGFVALRAYGISLPESRLELDDFVGGLAGGSLRP